MNVDKDAISRIKEQSFDMFKEIASEGKQIREEQQNQQSMQRYEPKPLDNNHLVKDKNEEEEIHKKIICLENVQAEEVRWLWYPFMPLGKVVIMQGDPGEGKTFVALAIASIISNGGIIKHDILGDIKGGIVLYQTAEDGIEDTIKSRLENMKANCQNLFTYIDSEKMLRLDDERLDKILKNIKPTLVIFDPIQAYLGADVDMNAANKVRPVLAKLNNLAKKHNCTMLLIGHTNKSNNKPLYKGLGSIDFSAAARSILTVGTNPKNGMKTICHVKSSCAQKGKSIEFELIDGEVIWKGLTDTRAEEFQDMQTTIKKGKQNEAIEFIEDYLEDGEFHSASKLLKEAEELGFSKITMYRAKDKLGISSRKIGGRWFWSLRDKKD